ncbi:MOSC domain-containing protein [Phytohabitans rumicis]|uniref:Molybdenum cofactor sulfurase n=1 Tax=Phytohabitans rumicis TaxID=1076125 RepID=A0A6V8LEN1_9ACTN|nr:MOSC domain-containing protein [Phytohabitans rumicis]GFJ94120.1 molybdenum cofactor sulfurase [Phytohabitans rumicis]
MRINQLWRYPVKSIGGEQLGAATVGTMGIEGDRRIAVHDERDELTWAGAIPGLMRVRAETAGVGVAELILPNGERFRSDAPDAGSRLSTAVQAKVSLVGRQPDWADGALHVLTTTALDTLAAALPDSAVDVSRFRPNLVLSGVPDESGTGYPEHDWIGRRLAVGTMRLRFTQGCERCVMITKETPTVPHDRATLRWVARELGNIMGMYAAVEVPGEIRVGDEARLI